MRLSKVQLIILSSALECTKNNAMLKFPGTPNSRRPVFFRYLPKKLAIFYPKFFPVIFFKYNPKIFPFPSQIFDLF